MKWWSSAAVVSLVGLGLGCEDTTGFGADFDFARAFRSCGPPGGVSTVIELSREPWNARPSPPYVEIEIGRDVREVEGGSFTVDGVRASGAYRVTIDSVETATEGWIHVDQVLDDTTVRGGAHLTFPSGGMVRTFSAEWLSSAIIITCP